MNPRSERADVVAPAAEAGSLEIAQKAQRRSRVQNLTALPSTFDRRLDPALVPELMDEPCSYGDFRDCVRDIAMTTRLTLAYRPTLSFLGQALQHCRDDAPFRVLDVGSGGGDVLRRVALWARKRKIGVHLTGIDLNPHATRAAREFSTSATDFARIDWVTGDVFTHAAAQHPDIVMSSLVTHHMQDAAIVRFLQWMEAHARFGWFVSDLARSAWSYRVFRVLARLMRWHPFVQHDGLVSIHRAFREDDWIRLIDQAGIPVEAVRLDRCALGRLCLTRLR